MLLTIISQSVAIDPIFNPVSVWLFGGITTDCILQAELRDKGISLSRKQKILLLIACLVFSLIILIPLGLYIVIKEEYY